MASQEQSTIGSSPTAQVIGNAFVQQYYLILHKSPELVHRFYQEQSKLGRPPVTGGDMLSVTTLQAINEKILSLDLMKAEIKTVDSQESLDGGVIVLVTGEITAHDDVTREFTQTFFLAPQEKGYFVLNDLFRYSSGEGRKEGVVGEGGGGGELSNGVDVAREQETEQQVQVTDRSLPPPSEEPEDPAVEEVYNPSSNGQDSPPAAEENEEEEEEEEEEAPVAEVIPAPPPVVNNYVAAPAVAVVEADAPKKSYASIVKVMKQNAALISAPVQVARSAAPAPVASSAPPARIEKPAAPVQSVKPAENPAFSSNSSDISTPVQELDDGHSVYVRNLPLNAMPPQLEEEFAKFGTIRPGGIQVRSHKVQGYCYGFVEFEDASSVQNAIAASPVTLAGRQCFLEEKRASGARGGNRGGRFSGPRGSGPPNSGTFRNENPRSGPRGPGPRGGYGRDFNNNNNNFRGGPGGPGPHGPGAGGPAGGPGARGLGARGPGPSSSPVGPAAAK